MTSREKIHQVDLAALQVLHYGDGRLTEVSTPIDDIDEELAALSARMFELMFAASGVGLAAPQVGVTVRMFVASPTYAPDDRRVYVNPVIVSADGWQEDEEGCLSVPGVTAKIKRRRTVTIEASGLDGQRFTETGQGLLARIFQHETDHLDGVLLVDRMGSIARMAARSTLKQLQERQGR